MTTNTLHNIIDNAASQIEEPQAIDLDPERVKTLLQLALQFLPFFLQFFQKSPQPPAPAPVQDAAGNMDIERTLTACVNYIRLSHVDTAIKHEAISALHRAVDLAPAIN